ncbi:MAG: flippase-like domain-containing protein [Elusimicrobia bacterium]|nr:flippase-like domain-containing protein [Elusimicrobiota bacterium]
MNSKRRRQILVASGLLASVGILAYLIGNHLPKVLAVVGTVDWHFLVAALACSVASYVMMGLALWEILALLGYPRSFSEVLGITYVSTTANYLVSTAGVSGFALKAHLLRKRNIPYGATVIASVVSTALMYFVLGVLIFQGTLYLFFRLQGGRIAVLEGVLGLGILSVTSVPLLMFFFNRELRGRITQKLFHWINHASFLFSKKQIPREEFVEFEEQLNQGLALIRLHKGRLTRAIGYTCLDWCFAMGVLYFGFKAVGSDLSVAYLSVAFAVGQATTIIPLLPGGMGAMEAVMATTMESLGTVWEEALVAVLVYRLAYFVLPSIGSIFILWGLKVSEPKWVEETVFESLPEELRRQALQIERRKRQK